MKNTIKRSLALFMAIAVCFTLVFSVETPAKAASYVYNWGTRGTVATSLSQSATSFYSKNNTSYAALSALSGASSESDVKYSALYKKLQSIMSSSQTYQTSYSATRDLFKYTDCQNGGGVTLFILYKKGIIFAKKFDDLGDQ